MLSGLLASASRNGQRRATNADDIEYLPFQRRVLAKSGIFSAGVAGR